MSSNKHTAASAAAQQQLALAKLQAARALVDSVDALIAEAELVLREDGAYERGDAVDVCSAVREEIAALEDYLQQYVN